MSSATLGAWRTNFYHRADDFQDCASAYDTHFRTVHHRVPRNSLNFKHCSASIAPNKHKSHGRDNNRLYRNINCDTLRLLPLKNTTFKHNEIIMRLKIFG